MLLENIQPIEKIGQGKSSEVYKVKNYSTNNYSALKVFKNQAEFENEKLALNNLQHKNIICSILIEENKILLEYCENYTLFDFIKQDNVKFPENIVRYYFWELLQTVEYIHSKGFVHRDIKLENILLDADFQLKLADFGFAAKVGQWEKLTKIMGIYIYIYIYIVYIFFWGVLIRLMFVGEKYIYIYWKLFFLG